MKPQKNLVKLPLLLKAKLTLWSENKFGESSFNCVVLDWDLFDVPVSADRDHFRLGGQYLTVN